MCEKVKWRRVLLQPTSHPLVSLAALYLISAHSFELLPPCLFTVNCFYSHGKSRVQSP